MTEVRRAVLRVAGAVAALAGTHQVATGIRGVRGLDPSIRPAGSANLDSELRFYAAWYAAAGAMMLRESARPQPDEATVRLLGAAWLAGAAGRVASLNRVGRPDGLFLGLLGAECAVAAVLLRRSRRQPLVG
jgi:hypothetical protein